MIIPEFRKKEMPDGESKKQHSDWNYYYNRERNKERTLIVICFGLSVLSLLSVL